MNSFFYIHWTQSVYKISNLKTKEILEPDALHNDKSMMPTLTNVEVNNVMSRLKNKKNICPNGLSKIIQSSCSHVIERYFPIAINQFITGRDIPVCLETAQDISLHTNGDYNEIHRLLSS